MTADVPQPGPWSAPPAPILAELEAAWKGFDGRVNLAVWHRHTHVRWRLGEEAWPAASLIKVPLAIAAYAEAHEGRLDLNETVPVKPYRDDEEADFDHLSQAPAGARFTWRKIIDRQLTESDNSATNALIERLGLSAIAPLCEALDLRDTQLRRLMLDREARLQGRENLTSATDMVTLLVELARGSLLPPALTQELLGLLGQQRKREKLAAGLPAGVRFAHKTGELPGWRHDAGLVGDDQAWAIAVMVSHPEGGEAATDALMATIMTIVSTQLAQQESRQAVAEAWLKVARTTHLPDPRLGHDSLSLAWQAGELVLLGDSTEVQLVAPPPGLGLRLGARLLTGRPGVVHVPCLQLRKGPGHHHELVSQARLGERLDLLEVQGDWWLLRAPDGYVAWGKANNVTARDDWQPDTIVAAPLVTVRSSDGRVLQLSAGSLVRAVGAQRYELPDGSEVGLSAMEVRPRGEIGGREGLLAFAERFLGLPYLWGGATGWGIDCSGLVQLGHAVMGIALPRDADQQQACLPAIADPADLRPGDPLFFPGHVGLWLGDHRFIHAAAKPGCVTINSFDPASPIFDAELRASFSGGGRSPLPLEVPVA
ncbi:MAG: serine hydrolase [Candidatus Sericytochromatia bacterium]|nr:serine hydrolase [Candidatus Sericytochromatia bacterium]